MKRKLVIAFLRVCEVILIAVFYLFRGLTFILPFKAMKAICTGLGLAFYYLVAPVRRDLFKTVSSALPELERKEVLRIAKGACCEGMYAIFDFLMYIKHEDKYLANLEIVGMEHYEEAAALNCGGIGLSCHLGAWTLSMAIPPHFGVNLSPIIYNPEDTMMPRLVRTLYKYGKRMGGDPDIWAFETGRNTPRRVTEYIKKGKNIGIPVDVGGSKIVELFGQPAAMASGIAHFACDTGAPILPANVYRGEKPYETRAVIRPMLNYELTGDKEADLQTILQAVMKQLEEEVREMPEQWSNWIGLGVWRKQARKLQKGEH